MNISLADTYIRKCEKYRAKYTYAMFYMRNFNKI